MRSAGKSRTSHHAKRCSRSSTNNLSLSCTRGRGDSPNRPRTIAVNRPYLPDIRAPYRNSCARDNASAEDRLVAEAPPATCRFFLRLRAIAQCVLPRRGGFVHPELLRGVLAELALNRQQRFPLVQEPRITQINTDRRIGSYRSLIYPYPSVKFVVKNFPRENPASS